MDTLPPLIVLFFVLKRKKTISEQCVFIYLIIQFILNSLANLLNELNLDNLFLYHLNCYISINLFAIFFSQKLTESLSRQIIIIAILIFNTFFFLNLILWENPFNSFNSNSLGLGSLFLIIFSLLYFTGQLKRPASENLLKSSDFWFVVGIFTYFTGSFFLFVTYRNLTERFPYNLRYRDGQFPQYFRILWQIHNMLFLLMCSYFFIGFSCKPSPKKLKL